MKISNILWLPDITDWWRQQEETYSMYTDLSNVAYGIFSSMPHAVGVEVIFSQGEDLIGWRQSKSTGEPLWEKGIVRHYSHNMNRILAGDYTALEARQTGNDLELKKEVEER